MEKASYMRTSLFFILTSFALFHIALDVNAASGTAYFKGRVLNFADCKNTADSKIIFKTHKDQWISQDDMVPRGGYSCIESAHATPPREPKAMPSLPTQPQAGKIERVLMPCPDGTTQQADGSCKVTSDDFVPRKRSTNF